MAQNDTSKSSSDNDKALYFLLTILPGATGMFQLYLVNGGTIYNPGINFVVTSSDDTAYIDCGFAGKSGSKNANIGCSYAPLSYDMTRQIFGKGVADRLIVVQVTVRNKSKDYEYLLQDIRLGRQGLMAASLDKKLARRISEKTEQFSARAISFRAVEMGATVMTGIAGVVGNDLLKDAANLVAGPLQSGYRSFIPDLSTAEIGTIDDAGFSVTSTTIPKNSAIAVVAFLSSEAFGQPSPPDIAFEKLKGDALLAFETNLRVQVAGIHIQEVDLNPTLTAIVFQDPSIEAGTSSADATVVVSGTALTSVDSVLLQQTGSQPLPPIKLTANKGQTSLDPNTDTIVIPAETQLQSGDYTLSLITTAGATVQPTPPVTLKVPPAISFALATPLILAAGAQATIVATVRDNGANANWTCAPAASCAGSSFNPNPTNPNPATSGQRTTFTAPSAAGSVTITATSSTPNTAPANAAVTITAPEGAVSFVIAAPPPATINVNSQAPAPMNATANDPGGLGVVWSCTPVGSCGLFNQANPPLHVSSGANVTYTAPGAAGAVVIAATATASATATATFNVNVQTASPK